VVVVRAEVRQVGGIRHDIAVRAGAGVADNDRLALRSRQVFEDLKVTRGAKVGLMDDRPVRTLESDRDTV
jgi:hypothetical protein